MRPRSTSASALLRDATAFKARSISSDSRRSRTLTATASALNDIARDRTMVGVGVTVPTASARLPAGYDNRERLRLIGRYRAFVFTTEEEANDHDRDHQDDDATDEEIDVLERCGPRLPVRAEVVPQE